MKYFVVVIFEFLQKISINMEENVHRYAVRGDNSYFFLERERKREIEREIEKERLRDREREIERATYHQAPLIGAILTPQ